MAKRIPTKPRKRAKAAEQVEELDAPETPEAEQPPEETVAAASDDNLRGKLPHEILDRYEVHEWKHASAILKADFPNEYADIIAVLNGFTLKRSHIVVGGKNKSKVASSLDAEFESRGWKEKKWDTKIVVDGTSYDSPTHLVDCFKNRVALELEWNNKDPFFDRDLNNFRLLFDLRVVSVGVIVTKSDDLAPLLAKLGIWSKYGWTTTWMRKLLPRINGGGGGGCPLLVFGIKKDSYSEE